ncbi:3',5'-cyclic-nucleotide phosphodiesterase [Burkholderia pseudomallei]
MPARCRPRTLKDRKIVRQAIKKVQPDFHPVAPHISPLLSITYQKRQPARTTLNDRYFP